MGTKSMPTPRSTSGKFILPTPQTHPEKSVGSGQKKQVSTPQKSAGSGHRKSSSTPRRGSGQNRKGWIEYPTRKGKLKRYPRRRVWTKENGEWKKKSMGRVYSLDPLTQEQYEQYKERRKKLREFNNRSRTARNA